MNDYTHLLSSETSKVATSSRLVISRAKSLSSNNGGRQLAMRSNVRRAASRTTCGADGLTNKDTNTDKPIPTSSFKYTLIEIEMYVCGIRVDINRACI